MEQPTGVSPIATARLKLASDRLRGVFCMLSMANNNMMIFCLEPLARETF